MCKLLNKKKKETMRKQDEWIKFNKNRGPHKQIPRDFDWKKSSIISFFFFFFLLLLEAFDYSAKKKRKKRGL